MDLHKSILNDLKNAEFEKEQYKSKCERLKMQVSELLEALKDAHAFLDGNPSIRAGSVIVKAIENRE